MIRWQHLSAESRESRRDSSETRQSTGRGAAGLVMLASRQYDGPGGWFVLLPPRTPCPSGLRVKSAMTDQGGRAGMVMGFRICCCSYDCGLIGALHFGCGLAYFRHVVYQGVVYERVAGLIFAVVVVV